jgi:hypothetical protein
VSAGIGIARFPDTGHDPAARDSPGDAVTQSGAPLA